MFNQDQMELSFAGTSGGCPRDRRQRRLARARWWFTQMRRAVDEAFHRQSCPPPRPEQVYLSLPRGR
jgi:hypothetical protein